MLEQEMHHVTSVEFRHQLSKNFLSHIYTNCYIDDNSVQAYGKIVSLTYSYIH